VCFHDAGWYPPASSTEQADTDKPQKQAKYHNFVLLKFLSSLKPWHDLKQQDLCLNILRACPELVAPYCTETFKAALEPRLSFSWIASVNFLQKIILLPVPSLEIKRRNMKRETETLPFSTSPPGVQVVLQNICPNQVQKGILHKGIQSNSRLVAFTSVILVLTVLRKLGRVEKSFQHAITLFEHKADKEVILEKEMKVAIERWEECLNQVKIEVRKHLPEFNILMGLERYHGENKEESETISMTYINMLRVVREYQIHYPEVSNSPNCYSYAISLFPQLISESNYDMGRFLAKEIGSFSRPQQTLLLGIISQSLNIKWFAKSKDSKILSNFGRIVQTYTRLDKSELKDNYLSVIKKVVVDSGAVPAHIESEVYMWLSAIQSMVSEGLSDTQQTFIIHVFDNAVSKLEKNPFFFLDKVTTVWNELHNQPEDMLDLDQIDISPLLLTTIDSLKDVFNEQKGNRFKGTHEDMQSVIKFVQRGSLFVFLAQTSFWKSGKGFISRIFEQTLFKRFEECESDKVIPLLNQMRNFVQFIECVENTPAMSALGRCFFTTLYILCYQN
jgi:hypothetical protein